MKQQPTDLEKFQALQITALQNALEEAQRLIINLQVGNTDLAKDAKDYAERIKAHVNNPDFHKPIVELDYSQN